jgi:hypothetical protein
MYNLAKCFWERLTKVDQKMCWILVGPKEIEYTSEYKVISLSNVLL